ncbi:hypothetical protein [Mycoplasma simbae]|uniref:hypothetical protein n=1 Tax=Mycoplasma simbae TaxID=36744 RepID=UPI000496F449|nr:hypothetical protein [Mycoplasma simbae]
MVVNVDFKPFIFNDVNSFDDDYRDYAHIDYFVDKLAEQPKNKLKDVLIVTPYDLEIFFNSYDEWNKYSKYIISGYLDGTLFEHKGEKYYW